MVFVDSPELTPPHRYSWLAVQHPRPFIPDCHSQERPGRTETQSNVLVETAGSFTSCRCSTLKYIDTLCAVMSYGLSGFPGPTEDLLASVSKRYTTAKRLVVRSASSTGGAAETEPTAERNVQIEVEFTGPLPSEGPGALLCHLLCGSSVQAKPVELPRGRKKRPRADVASSEASDSGKCIYRVCVRKMPSNVFSVIFRVIFRFGR